MLAYKTKHTIKDIRRMADRLPAISVCYCGARNLLKNHDPIAYTAGVYGWNFDLYEVSGVLISTGYRYMVGKPVDYERLAKYEHKAAEVWRDYSKTYAARCAKVEKLLLDFLKPYINGEA